MFVPRVPVNYVKHLISLAETQGCDVRPVLQELQIDLRDLDIGKDLSTFRYGQLYQRLMWLTQDEWFGMFAGGKVPLGSFRMMCLTLLQCTDLRQAIVRSGEFAEICRGMEVRYELEEDGDSCAILKLGPVRRHSRAHFEALQARAEPNHLLMTLFTAHRFYCWLVGRELPLRALCVTFDHADVIQPLHEFHAEQVACRQTYNGLVYDKQDLSAPIVQNQDSLFEFLRHAPYQLVTIDLVHMSLREKVRTILNRDVSGSMPSAEDVARQLAMSVTTLRRRLARDGTSYQQLKDECRLEAALHYLGCFDLTNTMVAERLGFDDPSAFFRVFKKWTGETPGSYRRKLADALAQRP